MRVGAMWSWSRCRLRGLLFSPSRIREPRCDRPVLVLVGIRSVKVGLAEVPSSLPAHSTSAAWSVILPVTPGGVYAQQTRNTRAKSNGRRSHWWERSKDGGFCNGETVIAVVSERR
jgi:hypothetical protein